MQEDDYTFVTIDNEDGMFADAVMIDVEDTMDMSEIVMIDFDMDIVGDTDFITLSDDVVMLSDADMSDLYTIDFDVDGGDISIMI